MQPRERFVTANGIVHHVLEWGPQGAADAVVLCHGFLDLAWGFCALAPRLAAAGLRVIAADFRGHGESGRAPPGSYYYFPDYVLDLHALLPSLLTQPFHLVGHSMGGTVSTLFAATHPAEVRTLALLEGLGPRAEDPSRSPTRMQRWLASSGPARRPESIALLRDLDDAFARLRARHPHAPEALLRRLADKSTVPHPAGAGLTWRFDPLHRTLSPIAFDATRFTYFLQQIHAPTLVVQGSEGFRSDDDAARIACLADARHAMIEGAGHMLHWTHDERVAALLLDHLQRA